MRILFFFTVSVWFFLSVPAWAGGVGAMTEVTASRSDTLLNIAREHGLGFTEIRAANPGIDPWLPGEGTDITLPKWHLFPDAPQEGIVINLAEMRLYYFPKETSEEIRSFPIGIGREGFDTPLGETKVSWKRADPSWTPTASMRKDNPDLPQTVPPGPDNPLGSHAIYLGWPAYLMHGTDKPWGIGRRVSSGCIRLYPEDIKQLYGLAEKGMPVRVVDQPVKLAWVENALYMEVHPPVEQALSFERQGDAPIYSVPQGFLARLMETAGEDVAEELNWPLVHDVLRQRRGYPVKIFDKASYGDRSLR